jgi:uncharacterized protein YfaS (alpha-2-macroglobulin family)
MKKIINIAIVLLLLPAAGLANTDGYWRQVNQAKSKGLPKTAIEALDKILKETQCERKYGEWLKALAEKLVLHGVVQGNRSEEKLRALKAQTTAADSSTKPLLQAIEAQWYWHYYNQNRWRFIQRTQTEQVNDTDFTTWDLKKIFVRIDSLYWGVLAQKYLLTGIPISAFKDFLEPGTMPESLRPTLYDFLAHQAIEFYTSAEQAGARPEDAFELDAASDALGPLGRFLAYAPRTTDSTSPKLKAIWLYQSLLNFHKSQQHTEALIDLDLNRLAYVKNNSFGEDRNKEYIARLEEIISQYRSLPVAALAGYQLARAWGEEGELVKAHGICAEWEKLFPNSVGGQSCRAYRNEIEVKTVSLTGERSVPSGPSKLQVRYKNFTRLYFRVVRDDWKRFMAKKWGYPNNLDDKELAALLGEPAAASWEAGLAPTDDFKEQVVEVDVPQLKPGYYRIFASWQPDFKQSSMVQQTWLWVCDYTMVVRTGNGTVDGLALDAVTGEPIPGAEATVVYRDNENFKFGAKATADQDGRFVLKSLGNYYDNHILLKAKGQELFDADQVYIGSPSDPGADDHTILFTDRSLYRPGQTVYFKGITMRVDQVKDDYKTLPRCQVAVVLRDANWQEVARQNCTTNDFGSFFGTFTAPADRLMGQMTICAEYPYEGQAGIRVEEYKRPKFTVEMEKPKAASRLNDSVTVTGTAMNYNGAAVDGAEVRFRVQRVVRWPWWWGWYSWRQPPAKSQEIAHGRIRTESDGSFKVTFFAKPDLAVSPKDDPSFEYTISADVTASDGETRSGSAVITLGYAALAVKISAQDDVQAGKDFTVTVSAQTLDGEPLAAGKVRLNVWKLKEPQQPVPGKLWSYDWWWGQRDELDKKAGEFSSNWMEWPNDRLAEERQITVTAKPESLTLQLPAGLYKIECAAKDKFGKDVRSFLPLMVLPGWDERRFPLKLANLVKTSENTVEVGKELRVLWGTGYMSGRALVEVEHRGTTVKRYWTDKQSTQHTFSVPVVEGYRGGFTVRVTQVRDNRCYVSQLPIYVPWDNKQLEVTAETFRDKLLPGQQETWKFRIKGKKQEIAAAERAAALYDFSLDQFYPHSWPGLDVFRREYSGVSSQFANGAQGYNQWRNGWNSYYGYPTISYTRFPYSVMENLFYYQYHYRNGGSMDYPRSKSARADMVMSESVSEDKAMPAPAAAPLALANAQATGGVMAKEEAGKPSSPGAKGQPGPKAAQPLDLSGIAIRKNLNETAFFFPQLLMVPDGSVSMSFTMPEALTKWKFLGFAHGQECQSGQITSYTVTQKQLMVQPNPPRFLREGDEIWFTAKVTNLSEKAQKGRVQVNFRDLMTDQPADAQLGLKTTTYEFNLKPKASQGFSWKITVPKGMKPLSYTVAAKSKEFSDGEAGAIPVLTSRIFITESVPLWIRGNQVKKFTFDRLKQIGTSETFDPYRLTLQMSSNPSWYAIQALPYLIEYPYECSEQAFNRLYGNLLAGHIANSDPKIRRVFDQWRGTDALKSNLEKNQQLKSVMLEETPWVLQAQDESQAKRNVGILFEKNTLEANIGSAYGKLKAMQLSNGAWPWFPGGRPDPYITLYVTTGFARLRHLGAKPDMDLPLRAVEYLDSWVRDYYDRIEHKELNHLSPLVAFYLYGRSFYLKDRAVSSHNKVAVDYFLGQARKFWLDLNSRMSQGYLALALHRFGDTKTAKAIMASIKERSVSNEEMGMFWREDELSWWWYRAPIETQALMVEAFDEVMRDMVAVEDCKVWLLKQKQTQDWKTTKATADVVYALILRGDDLLSSNKLVEVKLADMVVTPEKAEAGTGFYEKAYQGPEVKPQWSDITVTKTDKGIAWGGVHFQYFEDMSKVTPHKTNLSLEKTLFVNKDTKKGVVIEPVKGPLSVGDLVTVRVVLRVDRDMEYVHLKDLRGSGLEPTNVLSQYKYQDGLYYYESTRDAATHFFIDYLPKGTYVFEYTLRVQLKGRYQSGIAEIQCMYAPEFNSHSGSVWVEVR